jgi:hypothetical protein
MRMTIISLVLVFAASVCFANHQDEPTAVPESAAAAPTNGSWGSYGSYGGGSYGTYAVPAYRYRAGWGSGGGIWQRSRSVYRSRSAGLRAPVVAAPVVASVQAVIPAATEAVLVPAARVRHVVRSRARCVGPCCN